MVACIFTCINKEAVRGTLISRTMFFLGSTDIVHEFCKTIDEISVGSWKKKGGVEKNDDICGKSY